MTSVETPPFVTQEQITATIKLALKHLPTKRGRHPHEGLEEDEILFVADAVCEEIKRCALLNILSTI